MSILPPSRVRTFVHCTNCTATYRGLFLWPGKDMSSSVTIMSFPRTVGSSAPICKATLSKPVPFPGPVSSHWWSESIIFHLREQTFYPYIAPVTCGWFEKNSEVTSELSRKKCRDGLVMSSLGKRMEGCSPCALCLQVWDHMVSKHPSCSNNLWEAAQL